MEGDKALVTRVELKPIHDVVLGSWRELIIQSPSLGFADRIVIFVQLKFRAEKLSVLEGLAQDSEDLKRDTDAFVAAVNQQSPVATAVTIYSFVSGILGFFGLWSYSKISELAAPTIDAAQAGATQTAAAVTTLVAAASGGVLFVVARGVFMAAQAAVEALGKFSERDHPSAMQLRTVLPAESDLFSLFGRRVPSRPISAGPLILLGGACILAGVVIAFLVGVGAT